VRTGVSSSTLAFTYMFPSSKGHDWIFASYHAGRTTYTALRFAPERGVSGVNMKKRKLLILTMIAMLIVGGSYATYPFLASMNPSMKAKAEILSINIKDMKPGSYKISAHSRSVEYLCVTET
jgi:hypothetical protein